jgi:hypothetical protein
MKLLISMPSEPHQIAAGIGHQPAAELDSTASPPHMPH